MYIYIHVYVYICMHIYIYTWIVTACAAAAVPVVSRPCTVLVIQMKARLSAADRSCTAPPGKQYRGGA